MAIELRTRVESNEETDIAALEESQAEEEES